MQPTNIELIDPKKELWGLKKPVTTTDVVEGMTNNLHPDGLYSNEIFGRMGSAERKSTESYANLKLKVFVPLVFKVLQNLKGLYTGIMKGSEYAIWSETDRDFIKSNILEGETGYSFFLRHFKDIDFKRNSSSVRNTNIELIQRYYDRLLIDKAIILPAGLRDIEFEQNGSIMEPEINDLYRKLIFKTNSIIDGNVEEMNPVYDNVAWGVQDALNDIDDYLFTILDGKKGFIRRKMATRTVVSGTRNVITVQINNANDADEIVTNDLNSAQIGLFQSMMAFSYLSKYCLTNSILSQIFSIGSSTSRLVNKKTLSYEYVELEPDEVNKWITNEGINKTINGFKNTKLRNKVITVNDYYLCLTYDDGENVKIFGNIDELPEGFDKKHVRPTTYCELLYYYVSPEIEKRIGTSTRYPITGIGSITPVLPTIKTNSLSKSRIMLDDEWEKTDYVYKYFPDREDLNYFDSYCVPAIRLKGYGGDYDGDQMNFNPINGSDSLDECFNYFNVRENYVDGAGNFVYEVITESQAYLLRTLTADRKERS